MNRQRTQISQSLDRMEHIFCTARRLRPTERQGFLKASCGDDDRLRKEVEELLAGLPSISPDFLAAPPILPVPMSDELEQGARLGAYRLRRKIGHGGMGCVYLAIRDEQEQEKVAVKVLKRGLDTDELVRRFHRERDILSRLDHPFHQRLLGWRHHP